MMETLQQMLPLESLAHPAAIASLLLLVLLFLYWYGTRGFADLKKLNVPGPKPVPFLGNFLEARKYDGMHLMHLDYLKKYGKVYALCLGGRPSLVVADPELLKQIMIKDFPNFRNRFNPQSRPIFEPDVTNRTVRVVTGQPFDDPRGRWRVGGGINVPLKVQVQMTRTKARNLSRALNQIGVQNTLKECEEISDKQ
ncbi:hypothetical protein ACROYT_G026052 [Oculina patagonica]